MVADVSTLRTPPTERSCSIPTPPSVTIAPVSLSVEFVVSVRLSCLFLTESRSHRPVPESGTNTKSSSPVAALAESKKYSD